MKVAVLGILLATYLTFSYKCKSLILYWKDQVVEIFIITFLLLSLVFSYNSEAFVWMLILMMCLHQVIQLTFEISLRIKRQKIQRTAEVNQQVGLSA